MVKKTMQATQKLPTAKADIRPEDAKKPGPVGDGVKLNSIASNLPEVDAEVYAGSIEDVEIDFEDIGYVPEPESNDASTEASPNPDFAESPMSLADVNAILADNYPGYTPTDPRGDASGLTFTLPDGKALKIERKRVKACANMEELRAYVGGLL